MTAPKEQARRVREQNDQFRATGPAGSQRGRWVLSHGVGSLSPELLAGLVEKVRLFDVFEEGNDPYQEHDFGSIDWDGQTYFWKIDYYDHSLAAGSPDPGDPSVTTRVLTLMVASEY